MYLTSNEARTLADEVASLEIPDDMKVVVLPNTIDFVSVTATLSAAGIQTGAQNVAWVPQGAYTGATSSYLFKQAGASYALVGHSERRHIFNESNNAIQKKMQACLDQELIPILCIGETQEDLDLGKREYRLKNQIMKALEGIVISTDKLLVAYEPVWAISGSGKGAACDPLQAEETHAWIKEELKQYTSTSVPVLYGGSVDKNNVVSFVSCNSIDGVLVGSASTHIDEFRGIVSAYR